MSYEVSPYRGSELLPRDDRHIGRAVSRQRADALVRTTGIAAETDVVLTKINEFTMAVGQGMVSVARVGQVQRQCELQAPELSGRLNYLAENHLLGVDTMLTDYRHDLRRC